MGTYRRGGLSDAVRVALSTLLVISFGIFVVALIPVYDLLDPDSDSSLLIAYAVACLGVILAVVLAIERVLGRVRARRAIGWAPMVALPVLAESWLAGLLVALVLVSI